MLQQIKEQLWNHLVKKYCCQCGPQQDRKRSKHVCPRYHVFRFRFSVFLWNFEYIFRKQFRGDEDREMINFPLIKCTKAWI